MPTYNAPTRCTATATPGLLAVRDFDEKTFPRGAYLGIVRECPGYVRGTETYSAHAEGRGIDQGYDYRDPLDVTEADLSCAFYSENAEVLHTQGIVWNGRTWGFGRFLWYPSGSGTDPHRDHQHKEFDKWGAQNLTVVLLDQVWAEWTHGTIPKEDELSSEAHTFQFAGSDRFVYIGPQGQVIVADFDEGAGKFIESDVGGNLISLAAPIVLPSRIDLYGVGPDRKGYHNYFGDNTWHGWERTAA